MKSSRIRAIFSACAITCILFSGLFASAQSSPAPVPQTVPVLFLSDIHFEPFWDPAKAPQLAAAPIREWKSILAAPPSADREQRFNSIEKSCQVRGDDTSFPLFASSLQAMQARASGLQFVTVSGDLMAHAFPCKFHAVFPHAAPGDYRAFAEKTVNFVVAQLYAAFPGVPVYTALGNNDSDCGDYQLDAHSEFLSVTGEQITRNFPASERAQALDSFSSGGYYSIILPAPIEHARLLVLNDIYNSSKYTTCKGKDDSFAATEQLAWLHRQLAQARINNEKIWVMGHIPPGVDLHASVTKMIEICLGKQPKMYLSSEALADELVASSGVVKLALFAHTHMDEMHLLTADDLFHPTASSQSVAVKMVPSISPIDGNLPAFTLARIDPSTALLQDYRVFVASNSGANPAWREEYNYAQSYHQPDFSAASATKLLAGFAADPAARSDASRAYIRNFISGTDSPLLGLVWPQYICSATHNSAQGFRACACPATR